MNRAARILATGALAGGAALIAVAPAAADYPPNAPSLSVAGCSDVKSGVTVKVKDLQGGSTLKVGWGPASAAGFISSVRAASTGEVTTKASAGGNASVKLSITPQGIYTITAIGVDASGNAWTGNTMVPVLASCSLGGDLGGVGDGSGEGSSSGGSATGSGSDTEGLSDTGADTAGLLALSVGALAVGGAAVAVSRRRRSRPESV